MLGFTVENIDSGIHLVHRINENDALDSLSLRTITNQSIEGISQVFYSKSNDGEFLTYNITNKISAKTFFSGETKKETFVKALYGIATALLAAEEAMIDTSLFILDLNYIFVDRDTENASLICLPVASLHQTPLNMADAFKDIIFGIRFAQSDNYDYLGRVVRYLNDFTTDYHEPAPFSLAGFQAMLDSLNEGSRNAPGRPSLQQPRSQPPIHMPVHQAPLPEQRPLSGQAARQDEQQYGQRPFLSQQEVPFSPLPTSQSGMPTSQSGGPPDLPPAPMGDAYHDAAEPWSSYPGAYGEQQGMGGQEMMSDRQAAKEARKEEKRRKKEAKRANKMNAPVPPSLQPDYMNPMPNMPPLQPDYMNPMPNMPPSQPDYMNPMQGMPHAQPDPSSQQSGPVRAQSDWLSSPQSDRLSPLQELLRPQQADAPGLQPNPIPSGMSAADEQRRRSGAVNFGETTNFDQLPQEVPSPSMPGEPAGHPFLIRRRTSERIIINKPVFHIGKDRNSVDYFINDNKAISRNHAKIISRDNQYYVMDLNSTNATYINGSRVPGNKGIAILHGNIIKLANEEFEFYLQE